MEAINHIEEPGALEYFYMLIRVCFFVWLIFGIRSLAQKKRKKRLDKASGVDSAETSHKDTENND